MILQTPAFAKLLTKKLTQKQKEQNDLYTIIEILKKPYEKRNQKDLEMLEPLIKSIQFFKEKKLKDKDLTDICKRLRYHYCAPGKNAITHGERGDQFYIILDGQVGVFVPIPKQQLIEMQKQQQLRSMAIADQSTRSPRSIKNKRSTSTAQDSNNFIEGFREVAQLGPGKSFGELALIQNKPRAATIRCYQETHFATLDKFDYETSLMKIERKHQNKILEFMMDIPCFRLFTKNSILKFSYYLQKEKFKRNQALYSAGQKANFIYIIKSGEFEMTRKLPKDPAKTTDNLMQILGVQKSKQNIFNQKLSEIDDIPSTQHFMIVGRGSMIGEEDVITSVSKIYSCTVVCSSLKGSAYKISKEDFLTLKSSDDAWMSVLEKALWKEKQKGAEHIGDKLRKVKALKIQEPQLYDLRESSLQSVRDNLQEWENKKMQEKSLNGSQIIVKNQTKIQPKQQSSPMNLQPTSELQFSVKLKHPRKFECPKLTYLKTDKLINRRIVLQQIQTMKKINIAQIKQVQQQILEYSQNLTKASTIQAH
eukprot:403355524